MSAAQRQDANSSGSGRAAPKRRGGGKRGPSEKTTDKVISGVVDKQTRADRQALIEEVTEALRKDGELGTLIRAMVRRRQKKTERQTLRRGIRCLGDLPDYVVQPLVSALSGVCEGDFAQLSSAQRLEVLIWALQASKDFKLPSREMTLGELTEWAKTRHAHYGSLVTGIVVEEEEVDWQFTYGEYQLVVPEGEVADNFLIKEVRERSTQNVAQLPAAFRIEYQDVGETWEISGNFCKKTAELTNLEQGYTQVLSKLFAAGQALPWTRLIEISCFALGAKMFALISPPGVSRHRCMLRPVLLHSRSCKDCLSVHAFLATVAS